MYAYEAAEKKWTGLDDGSGSCMCGIYVLMHVFL